MFGDVWDIFRAGFDRIDPLTVGGILMVLVTVLLVRISRFIAYSWHRWRLARRIARDPYMLQEELREYEDAIGEKPDPIDWPRAVKGLLVELLFISPAFLIYMATAHRSAVAGLIALSVCYMAYNVWQRANDPEHDGPLFAWPARPDIPPEAAFGFAAAIAVIAAIILFVNLM
ncbi:MAG: hypothetical protein H6918_01085 [Sphingomonadaceae bacterium]|nr:hypothetical protein [Sphingomonadaceae bacterium]